MQRLSALALTLAIVVFPCAHGAPPAGAEVNGIGGFFFRAENPEALAAWYLENLGVGGAPKSYDELPWMQRHGPTVFTPFDAESTYFGPREKRYMVNFRTEDLDALVAHLRANDVAVTVDEQVYPNGRFARLADPEGNPIQLWEPADPSS
ncbi:MAG: VOC family protein [Pseudomonadota bacterium]